MRPPAWALAVAVAASSCARPLMTLPTGSGTDAPDAPAALARATETCRAVRAITAEVAVSGAVAGQRVRARLLVGLADPESARLEAVAAFGPAFIFAAANGDAALLLPHDGRVVEHGAPADLLEAVSGLPLGGDDLRSTLTGCTAGVAVRRARAVGGRWIVVTDERGDDIYLGRGAGPSAWRVVAIVHHPGPGEEWRAEFDAFQGGLPTEVRLAGRAARAFDLRLVLSQVDVNMPIDPQAFRLRVPPSAVPMSLTELREAGPLGATSHGR